MKAIWIDRRLVVGPYIGLCLSQEIFTQEMTRLDVPPADRFLEWIPESSDGKVHWLTNSTKGLVCLVCIRPSKVRTPIEYCGLIVHEAVHVWQIWRREIGEDRPSAEFEAYSIQAIAQDLMLAFSRGIRRVRVG